MGSKSSLTVKLSTTQEAQLCSTQARKNITTRAKVWKSILGRRGAKLWSPSSSQWLETLPERRLLPGVGRGGGFSAFGPRGTGRGGGGDAFIADAQMGLLIYFHVLHLNAEFKSTANPVNKIPASNLMDPGILQSMGLCNCFQGSIMGSMVADT